MHPAPTLRRILLVAALAAVPVAGHAQAVEIAANADSDRAALLDEPARLHVEGVTLLSALTQLSERSGVPLAYSPTLLPEDVEVTCRCAALTVREALDRVLDRTAFSFRETDGQVILAPARSRPALAAEALAERVEAAAPARAAAGVGRVPATAAAQPATITGRVTSEGGVPVGGAMVRLPRLELSTVTSEGGTYRLVVPAERVETGEETLEVTRIGFRARTVSFPLRPGAVVVNITLTEEAVPLDALVVSGTAGNLERRAQPATVSTIDASQVVRQAPVRDVTQLLQARVPGVSTTHSSGTTGAAPRINIRGAASISLSNQPLVFIDGVRVDGGARGLVNVSGANTVGQAPSALNDLNPADIETIEVVKGPAAATLYGADASAGVIHIITKRGRVGTRSFTQDLQVEYDHIDPNFAVPTNYAACIPALVGPDSPNPLCRGQAAGTVITDNPAARIRAFRPGDAVTLNYSARGGGDTYGYFASFGIGNEQGTTLNNRAKHRTGRVNFTFAPSDILSFDASLTLSRNEYDLPRSDQDTHGYYIQSILGSPLTVFENDDGSLGGGMLFGTSSLESMSSVVSRVSALRSTPSVQVRFEPTSWFSNRLTVGADLTQGRGFQMFPRNDFNWYPDRLAAGNGDVSSTQEDDRQYTVDYAANIRTSFGSDGQFSSNLSFGSQYLHRVVNRLSGSGAGLVTNAAILVNNTATSTVGQGFGESKALGLFVQEQLGYRDRLYVQVGMRADRNSAFGSEVGTFFLPKLGASYVISEESFWAPISPWITTMRLRAAYGTTGRSPASGAALRTYSTARYVTDTGVVELGLVPGNPGNRDLKPERGSELELGFDAGFLDDRIGAELTYFDKKSTDLLVNVPVAPSSGFGSSPFGNIGEVRNRGLEFMVRGTPLRSEALAWDLSLGGSTLSNEIVSLGTAGTFINNFRAFVPGRQIAAWWVHRVRGVDEAQGLVVVSDTAEFAGNQLPTFQGNLTSTVTLFRNLSIYALLTSKSGYHVYNLNQEFRDRSARSSREVVLGPDEGGYADAERLRRLGPYVTESGGNPVGAGNVKDPYIQKGDHVRFQELSATLTLPTTLANRFGATGASITVGGRNLGLWTAEFEGDDPDVLGTGPQSAGVLQLYNVDVFTTPPSRRWIVRMNLQF